MKMHKEIYEQLMLRFALELSEVGVSEDITKLISDQINRSPNVVTATATKDTDQFTYRHDGYIIEAVRTVKLSVRSCKS